MSSNISFDIKKHSMEHVMVLAFKRLYPSKFTLGVGPIIDNGFYQDFDFETNTTIEETDFGKLTEEIKKIIDEKLDFQREEVSIDDAIDYFNSVGESYKVELLEDIKTKGTTKLDGEEDKLVNDLVKLGKITLYTVGEHKDLCRGPHVNNTEELSDLAFKLDRMAGAYWRGSADNKMLTRVYALCFENQQKLDEYLTKLEEAKKRDHKILGRKLDLFVFSDLVGGGLPLWTPKGTILRNVLDDYVWNLRKEYKYEKVEIPHITKKDLYETSGHWDKYKDDLFRITTREGHEFCMKPMNCPHHTQIFARKSWSYREMPQRYANTTACYRDEQTGELSGLSRVRGFSQDDAHVFCRITQAREELQNIWNIVHDFYKTFGMDLKLRLSLRDPQHLEKYLGNQEHWDEAEKILKELANSNKTEYYEGIGEAAFYAPKLDFMAEDSLGRVWQVATIQLDVNMPERFDLNCINESGDKERIVMIHAAIMGSIDRFLSIIIEHFGGDLPFWIAPTKIRIVPISNEKHLKYSNEVWAKLSEFGINSEVDDASETMNNKVRKSAEDKVNYTLVIGDKEMAANTVAIRGRGNKNYGVMDVREFANKIKEELDNKLIKSIFEQNV